MISDNIFQSVKMLWDCRLMEILKFKNYQTFLEKNPALILWKGKRKNLHSPAMMVLLKLASRGQCNPSQFNPLLRCKYFLGFLTIVFCKLFPGTCGILVRCSRDIIQVKERAIGQKFELSSCINHILLKKLLFMDEQQGPTI